MPIVVIQIIPGSGHYWHEIDDEFWTLCANPATTEKCEDCIALYADSVAAGGRLEIVLEGAE